MKPIAVFYHCLFYFGTPPDLWVPAVEIVAEQMGALAQSGLLAAADLVVVGINGGEESAVVARALLPVAVLPARSVYVFHGLASRAENLTLVELEKRIPELREHLVFYHHAKGCTHDSATDYAKFSARWRRCMEKQLVWNWRRCVADLEAGYEAVGCHWMPGMGHDHSQNIFGGNFWWARGDFLQLVPSIFKRDRIKVSGIAAAESRYEAEVWLGNAPRLPRVKDYAGHGVGACP